jgi:hypothetical protein
MNGGIGRQAESTPAHLVTGDTAVDEHILSSMVFCFRPLRPLELKTSTGNAVKLPIKDEFNPRHAS